MKHVITFATNASLTKYEVKIAEYKTSSVWFLKTKMKSRSIKKCRTRMRTISSHFDQTALVNKGFIIWLREL